MTTSTDQFSGFTPPPPPTGPSPQRLLRRSRSDRVGAGVAGGLGEYFGVDSVLFRVLFATAAFFGGAGVLAYLLAWAAIPEQGTVNAPVDRFVIGLRRRHVPVWLVAIVVGLVFWGVAFSWWAPRPFLPIIIVVIILVAIFGRRARRSINSPPAPADPAAPVSLDKSAEPTPAVAGSADRPVWVGETRQWLSEARAASRERRRRAFPVRMAALAVLVLTIGTLAAIDAATGIALPVYFWVTLGIVLAALFTGMALRRTPWSLASLVLPSVIGLIAFGGTSAQLHDGFGVRDWVPTSAGQLQPVYRVAFGQGVLDLTGIGTLSSPQTVRITMAAGQIKIILPSAMNATVDANVHLGVVEVDGQDFSDNGFRSHGMNVNRTILPAAGATGAPITIEVHLADGNISIDHRG